MIVLQLALLLLPAQQPTEPVQPAPVAPRRGMVDLRWNVSVPQARRAAPEVVVAPTEPRVEVRVEPRLELSLAEPVIEFHDPAVQAAPEPARQGRSWIGVELASDGQGNADLEVGRVVEGSPAERAELEEGDRLVALDGESLESFQDLRDRLDQRHPGQRVKLTVERAVEIELDQRGFGEKGKPRLGVRLSADDHGLLIDSVESGWPAEEAGLRGGDRITSINGNEVRETSDLTEVLSATEPGSSVEIHVQRTIPIELGTFPDEGGQAPGAGAFRLEVPQERNRTRTDEPQIFGLPRGGSDFQVQPVPRGGPPPSAESQGSGLESELRSLRDELRSLREELRALRSEIDDLRRSGASRRVGQ
jgi:membrane-associated protease RseP (regulator of RpoE activity)